MRPVVLRMDGFAAFRAETTIDFSGAEYFALVGPTGSGKSTVIDAMVFALYASVPRWDDRRAVRLALAPTTSRGTISLVFDSGDRRYVVAREIRRAASGNVNVRTSRLERLLDADGVAAADEETVPMAEGAKVTEAVTELLGLPFEDFCTCVVLPQGDFAEFLHAAPAKRQEKLERILGLGVYDEIMRRANVKSSTASQRAEILDDQLRGLLDATPAAEQAAEARITALTSLVEEVEDTAARLSAATDAIAAAEDRRTRLAAEREALTGLVVPDGVAELAEGRRAAAAALTEATERAEAAERHERHARSLLDATPDRAGLEQARDRHVELARLREELPQARRRHEEAADAFGDATAVSSAAADELEAARHAAHAAADADNVAVIEVRRLESERETLLSTRVPTGLDDLAARSDAASEDLQHAEVELESAEGREREARTALAAAPDLAPLQQALRDYRELATMQADRRSATEQLEEAEVAQAEAASRLSDTQTRREAAREELAAIERADLAAALRPSLSPGSRCPVCEQDVDVVPEIAPPTHLDDAKKASQSADRHHAEATALHARADATVARIAAEVGRLDGHLRTLAARLDDAPTTQTAVEEALAEHDRLSSAVIETASAVRAARGSRDAAARAQDETQREAASAADAFRAARDPLVSLGAPAIVALSPLDSWRALSDWARTEAESRARALVEARVGAEVIARGRVEAEHRQTEAEDAAQRARDRETTAARADQEAHGQVAAIDQRITHLREVLDVAPDLEEVTAELRRIADLDAVARSATEKAHAARATVSESRRRSAAIDQEVEAVWSIWRRARDPLVALGAPTVSSEDVGAAWITLVEWAHHESAARVQALAEADEALRQQRTQLDEVQRRLAAALAAHDLAAPDAHATAVVATALERARADLARVQERRAQAAVLDQRRRDSEEEAAVARMLGDQLRSNRFPRWLVASALDALVADASTSLADLSGGQFELTHDNGEFLVVDHDDADARRPVKTLSGGETFQASLALALALSSQLQSLAARGAARLESIFLDEGFGTLDQANLDLVATALENLAARGDRMVGVVTHVPTLAERVPIRFVVTRDHNTSAVARHDA